jgi:WD repeat and SOF domain-containing protein 1
MSLFGQTKRHTPTVKNPRRSPLPIFAADHEKKYDLSSPHAPSHSRFFTPIYLPLPRFLSRTSSSEHLLNGNGYSSPKSYGRSQPRRYVKVYLPIPPRMYSRIPRLNTPYRVALGLLLALGLVFVLLGFRKRGPRGNTWTPPFTDPDTLVLSPEEVAMVWEWEVLSGHYPSLHPRESARAEVSKHAGNELTRSTRAYPAGVDDT